MEKDSLEEISVGTAPTEVITNYLDADRDRLTNFDEIINDLLAGLEQVLRGHMVSSALHQPPKRLKDRKTHLHQDRAVETIECCASSAQKIISSWKLS